jgi:hypothetical protein
MSLSFSQIPDKRYCFDRHVPEKTIADVLDDYYHNRFRAKAHKLKSVIEHHALTGHTNSRKYWRKGSSDNPRPPNWIQRIKQSIQDYEEGERNNKYIDVHNYQFTPQGFAHVVDALHQLELTPMRVHRLYETPQNSVEFYAILKKCGQGNDAKVD